MIAVMAQLILITVNTGRFAHMSYVGGVGNGDGDLSGIPLAGEGRLIARNRADQRELVATVIESHGGIHPFGAVFVEVHVDPGLGAIRVPRVVGACGVGKLMNTNTGHSQLMGRIVWGLGMGLIEKTEIDSGTGAR